MRILLTILFLKGLSASATNYYFSASGSDGNNGTSPATAWQTNTKFNNTTFTNGDSIFFNRGDSWLGQFKLKTNSLTDRIYIGNYGSGNKPLFTGFEAVTGWTSAGTNKWKATASDVVVGALNAPTNLNTVLINGYIGIKARNPNNSYSSYNYSLSTDSTLYSASSTNRIGDEVAVKPAHWIWDVCKITGQSGNLYSLNPKMTYAPFQPDVNQYFLCNDTAFLDLDNEWVFNDTTKTLYVHSISMPTNVKVSITDTVLWLSKNSNVTISGIDISGANKVAVQLDTCSRIILTNSNIKNCGAYGLKLKKTNHSRFDTDTLLQCLSNSIYGTSLNPYTPMIDTCVYDTIINCVVDSSAIFAGMGRNGNSTYTGIWLFGESSAIINSSFTNTGYVAIVPNGKNFYIYQTYVNKYSQNKDDGGGIHTGKGDYVPLNNDSGMIIRKAIVLNGGNGDSYTSPLYLDDSINYVTVDSSIFYNGKNAAGYIHVGHDIILTNSILDDSIGHSLQITGSTSWTYNLNIHNNIFVQRGTAYTALFDQFNGISTLDYDYYFAPYTSNLIFFNGSYQTLANLISTTGFEAHSKTQPQNTLNNPNLYYNNKLTDSALVLTKNQVDITGTFHAAGSTIVLHPFTGIEMFDTNLTISYSSKATRFGR